MLSFHVHTALSAGIICASLALGEAGIEMYDLVSSCSLVRKQLCLEILVLHVDHFNFDILVYGFSMVWLTFIVWPCMLVNKFFLAWGGQAYNSIILLMYLFLF